MKNWPDAVVETSPPLRTPDARRGTSAVMILGVAIGAVVLSLVSGSHTLVALIAVPIVVSMAWSNPEAMIALLPVWLVMLGFIRRITAGGSNVTFSGDPLLLIAPIALLVLWIVATRSREPGRHTPLARWILIFNVLALLQTFNPSQGSLLTGLGGLLFVTIPTLAFWVGRKYAEPGLIMRIIWTVAILSLVSACYGLYQQFVGWPSWDSNWIASKGYAALNVGNGVVRAFASFSSAQEYAVFLSVGAVAWAALLSRSTRLPLLLHLSALATILVALFYESQRTSVFLTALAFGVMGAARLKMRPWNVALAGTAAIALLMVFAGAIGGSSTSCTNTQSASCVLTQHQLSGITNPTGANSSLSGHIAATRKGVLSGFKHPLGRGTGASTLAAGKYSANNHFVGTEFDPGNMAIDFGVMGIVVYAMLLWTALSTAYRFAVRRRDAPGLFVIGIAAATMFQWANGDLYSVCWLIWLFFGFADVLLAHDVAEEKAATPTFESFEWRRPGTGVRRDLAQ